MVFGRLSIGLSWSEDSPTPPTLDSDSGLFPVSSVDTSDDRRAVRGSVRHARPDGVKTLNSMGSQHGYGIARRIEQIAQGSLSLNQGTIYPALLPLEQKGWITASWGTSENNRRARFYAITRAGKKQLALEEKNWARTVSMVTSKPFRGQASRSRRIPRAHR